MIAWVIFDMDGLLIDSEPFWKIAEKKIFSEVWICLTHDMMLETVWLKVIEVVDYWFQRFPWNTEILSQQHIAEKIVDEMIVLIQTQWVWKKWYKEILQFFHTKWWKIWLNSASDYRLIHTVLDVLDIQDRFHGIHSGQDEQYGKPHPGWYIHAAEKLWVYPVDCLVFEDSLNWVLSAKSARMRCVAVPEEHNLSNQKFSIADMILNSLDEFDEVKLQKLTA
jgi:beta-phosphoglucomutase-like phosphatase (HAD superfamily)